LQFEIHRSFLSAAVGSRPQLSKTLEHTLVKIDREWLPVLARCKGWSVHALYEIFPSGYYGLKEIRFDPASL
jgi:hypothetical protein